MQHKFGQPLSTSYGEVPQINPLRWEILFLDENKTFIPQTSKFKCKDFLNDIVSARNGYSFAIYGFDSSTIHTNDEGVWFRLSHIGDYQQFRDNIDKTINVFFDELVEDLITVEQLDNTTILMFIPIHFFDNTYKISLCSYLIRLCNYGEVFTDFKSALESQAAQRDNAIRPSGLKLALEWMFDIPEEYSQYWYYAGKDFNSVNQPNPPSSIIHNNGVYNWSIYQGKK